MAKFYITIVQAVLLYGADTWVICKRDMQKLRSFHNWVIRYITGKQIRKDRDGEWSYPVHIDLLKECNLFDMGVYIERRRGTLRKYLEENRSDLLEKSGRTMRHGRDVHKILWWNQSWKTKSDMRKWSNFWFNTV